MTRRTLPLFCHPGRSEATIRGPGRPHPAAALDPGSGAGVTERCDGMTRQPLPLYCHPGRSEATIRGPARPHPAAALDPGSGAGVTRRCGA